MQPAACLETVRFASSAGQPPLLCPAIVLHSHLAIAAAAL